MESIGHSTLLDNFAKLTGSALDPGSLADELFQRNLINKAIAGEASSPYVSKGRRLHAIVMAVMGNGSPDAFKTFVEAVRKDQASVWLAQALIDTYRSKGGRWEDGTTPSQYPPSYQCPYAPDPRLPLRRPCFPHCKKPTLKYLVRLPRVEWFNVGLQLDLEDDELTTIQKNHPHDDEQARREMYRLWLQRKLDASYQQLVDAMCIAGANAVADIICKKFGLNPSPSTPSTPQGAPEYPSGAYAPPPSLDLRSIAYYNQPSYHHAPPTYMPHPQGSMATGYSVPGTMYSMQQSDPYPSMNPTHPAATAGPPSPLGRVRSFPPDARTYSRQGSRTPPPPSLPKRPPMPRSKTPPPRQPPAPSQDEPPTQPEQDDSEESPSPSSNEEELEDSPFFPDDGKRIMRDDDGEEVKYVRYEPHPTSTTGKLKSMTLSFGKVKIDRRKPQKQNPYKMKADPHGIAIVINNKMFDNEKLRDREGTDIDEANLIETLRYHRYIVDVYRDCAGAKMLEIFEEVRQMDHKGYDSFICCILSHGKEGHIYGSDGDKVGLDDITAKLNARNCASLAQKPKMFFVQACRGSKQDPVVRITVDGPGEEEADQSDPQSRIEDDGKTVELPSEADFLFSYASPYGQACFRDLDHGSWYISELCRALCCSSTHLHLNDMLLQVNKKVGEKVYKYRQAPEVTFRLCSNVYF